eukprot:TRINITY_DN6925_c0_g1_i2.p1 TRINITY_DN6925_c0_g1~~TRINITY_DN6925_c0_g1_i2.p1  ORF type:complete len:479 (+),score=152.69 TRINITY_DN6925_c0_g1_i2:69-1505(+)
MQGRLPFPVLHPSVEGAAAPRPRPAGAAGAHPVGDCGDEACDRCYERCVLCPQRVPKGDTEHLLAHLAAQRRQSQQSKRQCSCCLDAVCTCIQEGADPRALKGGIFAGVPSPVTVITGFLGSGKSTLVDAICAAAMAQGRDRGLRVAVLVNEFADTAGIERAAGLGGAARLHREDWLELGGGCVCCRTRGDTARALVGLINSRGRFDHILVETSGIADPGIIGREVFEAERDGADLRFAGVVCTVDAAHARQQLDLDGGTLHAHGVFADAAQQLAQADTVVLTKCDLVSEEERGALRAALQRVNPAARLLCAAHGRLDDGEPTGLLAPRSTYAPLPDSIAHHQCESHHPAGLGWVEAACPRPFADLAAARRFAGAVGAAAAAGGAQLLRVKGLLCIQGDDEALVLQGVGAEWALGPRAPRGDGRSRAVFIGCGLGGVDWQGLLAAHSAAPPEAAEQAAGPSPLEQEDSDRFVVPPALL